MTSRTIIRYIEDIKQGMKQLFTISDMTLQVVDKLVRFQRFLASVIDIQEITAEIPSDRTVFWEQLFKKDVPSNSAFILYAMAYPEDVVKVLRKANKRIIDTYEDFPVKKILNEDKTALEKTAKFSDAYIISSAFTRTEGNTKIQTKVRYSQKTNTFETELNRLEKYYDEDEFTTKLEVLRRHLKTINENLKPFTALTVMTSLQKKERAMMRVYTAYINIDLLYLLLKSRGSPASPAAVVDMIKEASTFYKLASALDIDHGGDLVEKVSEEFLRIIKPFEAKKYVKIPLGYDMIPLYNKIVLKISTNAQEMKQFNPPEVPGGEYALTIKVLPEKEARMVNVIVNMRSAVQLDLVPFYVEAARLYMANSVLKSKKFREQLVEFIENAYPHVEQKLMNKLMAYGISHSIASRVVREFRTFKKEVVSKLLSS